MKLSECPLARARLTEHLLIEAGDLIRADDERIWKLGRNRARLGFSKPLNQVDRSLIGKARFVAIRRCRREVEPQTAEEFAPKRGGRRQNQ